MADQYPNLPANLNKRVRQALRDWHDGVSSKELTLQDLLVYQQVACKQGVTPRQATNAVLEQALVRLYEQNAPEAELLRMHYVEACTMEEIRKRLDYAESTVYNKQNQAIHHLETIVAQMEQEAWPLRLELINSRIDAPVSTVATGTEAQVQQLSALLASHAPPWIISIEGIGGIGKTTLAVDVMRLMAKTLAFDDFGWVSAQPAILDLGGSVRPRHQPALTAETLVDLLIQQLAPELVGGIGAVPGQGMAVLRHRLKQNPHLIVIDNLETIPDLEALVPTLQTLANPTKFILTSRRRMIDEPDVYLHLVPELDEMESLTLLRKAATQHGLRTMSKSHDVDLKPIYETVGGHPLALLLVVGQMHLRSLDTVLVDLQHARSMPVESLYTFIYRQAWESLDEASRRVLLAMPLTNIRGESKEYIQSVCQLAPEEVASALQRLITLNLVRTTGELLHKRYFIHSLTRTFLQEQVARWQ